MVRRWVTGWLDLRCCQSRDTRCIPTSGSGTGVDWVDVLLEVPCADAQPHLPALEVLHEFLQPRLRLLLRHRLALDGADFLEGFFLLAIRGGEGTNVAQNIDGFGDGECFSANL